MTGLILKDFLNLRKQVLPLIIFLAVYFFIAVVSKNSGFFSGMAMILSSMLPISALSYDERAGFTKYALTMPISRSALVLSKYAVALILLGFSSLACLLVTILIGETSFILSLASIVPLFLMGIFIFSISLPCIFKFGTEKGRFVMIGSCMLIAAVGAFSALGASKAFSPTENGVPDSTTSSLVNGLEIMLTSEHIVAIIVAIAFVIFFASLTISLKIYKNKDF